MNKKIFKVCFDMKLDKTISIKKSKKNKCEMLDGNITFFSNEEDFLLIGIELSKHIGIDNYNVNLDSNYLFETETNDLNSNFLSFGDKVKKLYEGLMLGSWKYSGHKTMNNEDSEASLDKSNLAKSGLMEINLSFDLEKSLLEFNNSNTNEFNQTLRDAIYEMNLNPELKKNYLKECLEKITYEIDEVRKICECTNFARELVEMPSNFLTPSIFAEKAKKIEKESENKKLKITIIEEVSGGILEVSKGSLEKPKLIVCEYYGGEGEILGLVGKGVTFDSGGLSLKPAKSMEDMKTDMAGAANVLSIMKLLSDTNSKKNVVAVMPCVENMPSGSALKPGDVISAMSGQTIEVLNTDAEGRLILCDALWYIQEKLNAKTVIDFATLTGSVVVGLGELFAGLFSNDDFLSESLIKSGKRKSEFLCRLPLHKNYDKLIDSDIADMCNIQKPGSGAGSITAAQFLQRFVKKDTKWAHIDIAGTAYTSHKSMINLRKSTGFGVRLMFDFIQNI
ncbi:leucyl aminopeptidase family protein [Candidatus Nesciobacter abundans]|uniref:Leucyl aminopeptidase n=1 Tax=Candidatus Nesciobacter abundans TaxID=2601668 RepID=A0A5C0UGB9_9PROT|nr:leucyl aminopeptidase [Candidatus Nesciobacter abundans]QEK39156.1 leucyl aminopeptidase [Candidatus Nesciobacter abundans]